MSNRIEPGCLALVINAEREERIGATVTVIRPTPPSMELFGSDGRSHFAGQGGGYWEVDPGYSCARRGGFHSHESNLLRIDGGAESAESHAERCRKGVPA